MCAQKSEVFDSERCDDIIEFVKRPAALQFDLIEKISMNRTKMSSSAGPSVLCCAKKTVAISSRSEVVSQDPIFLHSVDATEPARIISSLRVDQATDWCLSSNAKKWKPA